MKILYLLKRYLYLKIRKIALKYKFLRLIYKNNLLTDEIFVNLEKSINIIKEAEIIFKSNSSQPIPANIIETINLFRYLLIESSDFHIAHQHLSLSSIGTSYKDRWAENFYLRIMCNLSYEFLNDAIEVTGNRTNRLIESYTLNEIDKIHIKEKLNEIRRELQSIFKSHNNFLKEVRNNTIAHKNHDSYITMNHIENLDFYKSIEVFNKISHCQKLLIQFCTNLFSINS